MRNATHKSRTGSTNASDAVSPLSSAGPADVSRRIGPVARTDDRCRIVGFAVPDDRSAYESLHAGWMAAETRVTPLGPAQRNTQRCLLTKTATAAHSTLRILGWNANGGLAGKKAARLAALNPDLAVVSECAQDAEVPGLVRVGWTGTYRTKGLWVFARPELGATVDSSWDSSREWFLPVHLVKVGVDVLAVWAMNDRGGEGQPR